MNEKRLDKQDVWMDGWMDKKNQGGKGNPSSILLGIQIYTGICPTSHCDILIHPFTHISNHSFFNLSIYPFIRPFIHQSSPPSIFSHQAIRPYLSIHLSIVLYPQTFSTIHIYIYLFSNHPIIIFPSIYPSVLLPIQHPYTFAYPHHFNSSSIHPFIILPISQSIHPSIYSGFQHIHFSTHHVSIYILLYMFMHRAIHFSIYIFHSSFRPVTRPS